MQLVNVRVLLFHPFIFQKLFFYDRQTDKHNELFNPACAHTHNNSCFMTDGRTDTTNCSTLLAHIRLEEYM